MVIPKSVYIPWRTVKESNETIIRSGSEIMVKGVLMQKNDKLYINPSLLTVNKDSQILKV